jgi:hypothetical protein
VGVPAAEFEPAYWAVRDAYDRGCDDLDYWRAVGQRVGVGVGSATSDALTELDILGWSQTEQATLDLLDALAADGSRMALLSNAPVSFARFAERQDWTRHFSQLVFSGDLRVARERQVCARNSGADPRSRSCGGRAPANTQWLLAEPLDIVLALDGAVGGCAEEQHSTDDREPEQALDHESEHGERQPDDD